MSVQKPGTMAADICMRMHTGVAEHTLILTVQHNKAYTASDLKPLPNVEQPPSFGDGPKPSPPSAVTPDQTAVHIDQLLSESEPSVKVRWQMATHIGLHMARTARR